MKITIELDNTKHTVETASQDTDMSEIANMMRGLLVSVGFHPRTVDRYVDSDCQWFPEDGDVKLPAEMEEEEDV
jgi:hypothetical protein